MAEKNADASGAGRVTVELQKDGPLKVSGLTAFCNSRGEAITARKTVFLCRCGDSRNRPFCDGTHVQAGFTDARSDDRAPDKLERYEGREVTILDNRGICSHAGYCTAGLPAVWRSAANPGLIPTARTRRPSSRSSASVPPARSPTWKTDSFVPISTRRPRSRYRATALTASAAGSS